ncbi:HNH endonuclease [Amycolatopsis thermoflava]|uniref:HNH endonuclease n=1 Tax=Amycolatopsis thermoflava TaxID=84480 RepID=UPI003F4A7C9A
MSESWAGGSTRRWRKIRLAVLNRDRWICQLCEQPIDPNIRHPHPMSAHVHHPQGKINGDDPDQLVAAHRICNLRAGDPNAKPDPEPRPMTRW